MYRHLVIKISKAQLLLWKSAATIGNRRWRRQTHFGCVG